MFEVATLIPLPCTRKAFISWLPRWHAVRQLGCVGSCNMSFLAPGLSLGLEMKIGCLEGIVFSCDHRAHFWSG